MVYIGPCVIRQNGLHWSVCYMTKWFTLVCVLYDKMGYIGSLCYTTKWLTLVCVLYDKMGYIGSLCYTTKWLTFGLVGPVEFTVE